MNRDNEEDEPQDLRVEYRAEPIGLHGVEERQNFDIVDQGRRPIRRFVNPNEPNPDEQNEEQRELERRDRIFAPEHEIYGGNDHRVFRPHWDIDFPFFRGFGQNMRREEEEDDWSVEEHDAIRLYPFFELKKLPIYVRRAISSQQKLIKCPMCNENETNCDFLDHLKICTAIPTASFEEEEKALSKFKSDRYYVNQMFCRLRERMELEVLAALLDPACRVQMACGTCNTLEDHLNGKCMDDNQKTAFLAEGHGIVQEAMNHYINFLKLEKESELENADLVKYKTRMNEFLQLLQNHSKKMGKYITAIKKVTMDPGQGPGDGRNIDPIAAAERARLNEAHFHNILNLINQERNLMGFQYFQAAGFREQDPFHLRPAPFPQNPVVPRQQGVFHAGQVQEHLLQQAQPALNELNRVLLHPHRFWNQPNDIVDRLMQRGGLMGPPEQAGEGIVDEEVARQRRAAHREEQLDRFDRHFRRNGGLDPGSDDEDGAAHSGYPRDFDTVNYAPAYIKKSHEDRLKKFQCPICNQDSFNGHFLEHLKMCAAEVEASFDEEEKALALFNSSEYSVRQSLARLREQCEVSYLCAMSDPVLRVQMPCEKCADLQEHLDGDCMDDNQKAVFRAEGERIVNKALSQYSDYMELEIKVEVDRITDRYTAAYERDTVRPLDQPINLAIEHERQQVLETMRSDPAGPESVEKETMKAKLAETHRRDYAALRRHFKNLVRKQERRMIKYIVRNRNHQLRDVIIQYRKENNFEAVTGKRYAIVKKMEIGLDGDHVSRWVLYNPV